jgi:peptidoglycan/LPS O-acetylase OafA/YrhL
MVGERDILPLTGLRFIAASSIAFGHGVSLVEPAGLRLHQMTAIGMPLFFTLSGFVIHYVYSARFPESWTIAAREFCLARFSRLYPLYIILFGYALIATPLGPALCDLRNLPATISYIFGVTSWWPFLIDGRLTVNWHYGIAWSISTEIFFYFCYAAILYRIASIRRSSHCVAALVVFLIFAILVFYGAFVSRDIWEPPAAAAIGLPHRAADFGNSFYRWLLYISPYSQIFGFISGCLTCQLYLSCKGSKISRCLVESMCWFSATGIIGMVIVFDHLGATTPWLAVGNSSLAAFYVSLHMNMLVVPLCSMLILALALRRTWMGALLSLTAPVFLGEISYSIYLGHPLATGWAFSFNLWPLMKLVAAMVATVVLAWLLYLHVEMSAKRWLRLRFRRSATPQLVHAPISSAVESRAV